MTIYYKEHIAFMEFITIILLMLVFELFFYYLKLTHVYLLKSILIIGDFLLCFIVFVTCFLLTEINGKMINLIIPSICVIFLLYSFLSYPKIKRDIAIYDALQRTGFIMIFWGDYNDIKPEQKLKIAHKIKKIYANHKQYSRKYRYSMFLRDEKEIYLLFAFSCKTDFEIFINNIEEYEVENVEKSGNGMICEMKICLFDDIYKVDNFDI